MNWYQKLCATFAHLRKQAAIYGYWVSPTGNATQVPYMQHDIIAQKLCKQLFPKYRYTPEEANQKLLNQNWAKCVTSKAQQSINARHPLTSEQQDTLLHLFHPKTFDPNHGVNLNLHQGQGRLHNHDHLFNALLNQPFKNQPQQPVYDSADF